MSCKGQPQFMIHEDEQLHEFQEYSTTLKHAKGSGLIGRVWENEK